jgi:hypothetical protein
MIRNIVCYPNPEPRSLWLYGWTQEAKARAARGDAIPVTLCGWSIERAAVSQSDYNLLYPIRGHELVGSLYYFRGAGPQFITGSWIEDPVIDRFQWWREQGFEKHSIVGDPLFFDVAQEDFRLKPDSPAMKLGFQPISFDKIGLYDSPERASWPIPEHYYIWREQPKTDPY